MATTKEENKLSKKNIMQMAVIIVITVFVTGLSKGLYDKFATEVSKPKNNEQNISYLIKARQQDSLMLCNLLKNQTSMIKRIDSLEYKSQRDDYATSQATNLLLEIKTMLEGGQ